MLKETFYFKDKRADSMGIQLQAPVKIGAAVPNVKSLTIPGKNGVLHYYDGAFANREIRANCFILSQSMNTDYTQINSWLLGENGYFRFSVSGDENHYMLARAVNGVEYNPRADILNPFSLTFDAKPQRFLAIGERELDVTETMEIYNPTGFAALPIVTVTGEGDFSITFRNGAKETTLSTLGYEETGDLTFDSETLMAYNGSYFLNNYIEAGSCPVLYPGKTEIVETGGLVTGIKIIPRWWEI